MILKTVMLGQTYEFKDVKELLAKASEKKSGDELAGVCAGSTDDTCDALAIAICHTQAAGSQLRRVMYGKGL